MEHTRDLIIDINTIVALFKDYCSEEDVPADAKPLKIRFNHAERKVEVLVESEAWEKDQPPIEVVFDIRRVFGVGNA